MRACATREDLTGRQFERLRVVEKIGMRAGRTFYRCICTCGEVRDVSCSKLLNGHTRSCGCLRQERKPQRRLPEGVAMRNRVLYNYKHNAKTKNVVWEITDARALELFAGDCYYCGAPPAHVSELRSSHGAFIHSGIDRLVNELGYVEGNVVSCCTECNFRKGDTPVGAFLAWVADVARRRAA